MPPHADTGASALLTSCVTTALRAQNFEHLTQAATGATSGAVSYTHLTLPTTAIV